VEYELIIVRYGEIALKGKATRKHFENILVRNIKKALNTKQISYRIKKEWGRIYVYTNQINDSIPILQKVFGITTISPAVQTQSNMDSISVLALIISKEKLTREKSFAVRVTRTGKHEFTSQDVAVKIGSDIVKLTKSRVNLTKPDFELFIEIRNENAFVFTKKIRGTGGLPLGTQGKVLCLVEDHKSILAGWYLMRRGCKITFINVNKTNNELFGSFISNWNIDADIVSIAIRSKNLYKTLSKIASEKNCDAIVTGYTLYDASSNCLSNIKLLKKYTKIPVLLPLIAMDEKTINKKSREIGLKP